MSNQPEIKIGDDIKVHLPGESPWTIVVSITNNGFIGRINNKLFHEYSEFEQARCSKNWFNDVEKLPKLHNYKLGDEVEFHWTSVNGDDEYWNWEPNLKHANEYV